MKSPDPTWAARELNARHVQELVESFLREGTVNKNVVGVLDIDKLRGGDPKILARAQKLLRSRLANAKDDALDETFADNRDKQKIFEACGLATMIGDHTRTAIIHISESHKHLSLFQETRCKVYVVDTANDVDLRMLSAWGNRDNIIAGQQLKPTFADYVLQLRRRLEHMKQLGEVTPEALNRLKKSFVFAWNIPLASVGQYYQIAKVTHPVEWALHEQLLRGDVQPMMGAKASRKKDGQTVPSNQATSAGYSTGLGNLSQEDRINVLTRLRNGELDCQGCRTECDRLKAMHFVRAEILTLANFIRKSKKSKDLPFPTWTSLQAASPRCTSSEFVDAWVNWVLKSKVRGSDSEKKPSLAAQESFKKSVSDIVNEIALAETRMVS